MNIFLGILGMAAGVLLIKYRDVVGQTIGDADWMKYVGGVYNFVILVGIFIFFFSLAKMTGTTGLLLAPLRWLIPGGGGGAPAAEESFF